MSSPSSPSSVSALLGSRRAALVILGTLNVILLPITLLAFLHADVAVDWDIYVEAGRRYFDGGLYDWGDALPWRYSPLLAPLFAVVAPIGYLGWSLLHLAALATLPWRIALVAMVSAPLWYDLYNGNTMTFVFVAAWHALGGSRAGTVAFFVLALLMPRPVMLPVLAWLLWHRREWIGPFGAMAGTAAVGTLLTGWGPAWIASELNNLGRDIVGDLGPSNLIGPWWYPIGFGLAAWITTRGRLGVASFLASGFWSLHYALMLLLELRPPREQPDAEMAAPGPVSNDVAAVRS